METCAFCGETINNIYKMVRSPSRHSIYICDKCVDIAATIIHDNISKKSTAALRRRISEDAAYEVVQKKKMNSNVVLTMTPSEIHQQLDRYIIGQERAKKVLSVAIYNHNKRLHDKTGLIKKSNILLVGPSGSGKTLLAKTLAKMLNLPLAITDATSLTESGYVGDDAEICVQKLIIAANGNIELAQKGIIYIDEIDKIARKSENRSLTKDVSGEGVQEALLKIIEGSFISVPVKDRRKHPQGQNVDFDTSNVLFICGGAFEGISGPSSKNNPMGFLATEGNEQKKMKESAICPESLIKYGMMPEFIGRLPVICPLNALNEDDLIRVLTEPEDAITKEYQLLFKKDGNTLIFEEEALKEIAKIAIKQRTGARGLRSILEDAMLDVMYSLPDQKDNISKCIITAEGITTKKPLIVEKRQRKKASTAVAASS